jgi:hypothetical protein
MAHLVSLYLAFISVSRYSNIWSIFTIQPSYFGHQLSHYNEYMGSVWKSGFQTQVFIIICSLLDCCGLGTRLFFHHRHVARLQVSFSQTLLHSVMPGLSTLSGVLTYVSFFFLWTDYKTQPLTVPQLLCMYSLPQKRILTRQYLQVEASVTFLWFQVSEASGFYFALSPYL